MEPKTKRINKKHYVLFNTNGTITATTPKDWARANQSYFPAFSFENSKNTPTVATIEKFLKSQMGFNLVDNGEVIIWYSYKSL